MSAPKPGPRPGPAKIQPLPDRRVHAESYSGAMVLVRYEKQGRWFVEYTVGDISSRRLKTVQEAAQKAVEFERAGGKIFEGVPGGKQFDSKVAGCRRRGTR